MELKSNFETIRHQIADKLLLVGMIVSIPAAIASGYRIFTMGIKTLFIVDVLISIILVFAYFTRSKTNYRKRILLLISYVFILGTISLSTFGLFGFGLFIIFFTIIILTALFGMRSGFIAMGVSAIIVLFFTFGIYYHLIDFELDFNNLSYSTYHWFSRLIFFLTYSTMTVITLGLIHKNFEKINIDLAESEARFKIALDSVDEVIWELDLEKKKTFVSDKFFELLSLVPNEFTIDVQSWKKLIHDEDIPFVNDQINNHLKGLTSKIHMEYRIKNKKGEWQWILTKGKIIGRDENGNPTRIVGTHNDISSRKEMEKSIKESEQKYRLLFKNANDAILLVQNKAIIDTNLSAYNFFGLERDILLGKKIHELSNPILSDGTDTQLKLDEFYNEILLKKSKKIEWEFKHSDGRIIDTVMSINLVPDSENTICQFILHDISEHKQFEQNKLNAIIETEERERLQLAGDLHDDVGPLLSSLNMYLSLLNRTNTNNKGEIIENMQIILKDTINSVREISNNLSPHTLERYGLLQAINSFIESSKKLVNIEINENIGENRLPKLIETTCYRIIKELINNSLKYANAKTISLKLLIENNIFYLSYMDNGIGFDFNKTISSGQKGLGLLNILNRLNTLKATYNIESKPGTGFRFEMKIRI